MTGGGKHFGVVVLLGMFLGLVLYSPSHQVHAQSFDLIGQDRAGATLELSPKYPRPGDTVTVKLKQYISDPKFLLVTWKLNGEVVRKGYDELSYTFSVGPVGSLVALEAHMVDRFGRTATAKKTFRVSDIAFVWEARSYTPPFYEGRSRLTYGSPVAIVALPTIYSMDGRLYDPSELHYTWFSDTKQDTSGVGKNSNIMSSLTPFENLRVILHITDPVGERRMTYDIDIPPRAPGLLLYEDDPLLGILYRSAIQDTYTLAKEELKVVAEPFFTSVESRLDPDLAYTWNVNSIRYDFPGSIVLRPEGSLSGVTNVSLTILNNETILERVQKRLSVEYVAPGEENVPWTDPSTNAL